MKVRITVELEYRDHLSLMSIASDLEGKMLGSSWSIATPRAARVMAIRELPDDRP